MDDPILTFEQKNRLDIERYEAYCAKSSFLHKKFVPKNLAQKLFNHNVQKTADSEIVLDKAIFNTRNFLLTGWSAAFFYLFGFSFFFFCIFLLMAEIDSDSHISQISEEYYEHLIRQNTVEHLPEQPMTFQGLGSTIVSKYPPIMLYIQIGRIRTRNRFIVTSLLKSSPILLGTDFTVNNMVSVAPFRDNEWFVTIGSLYKPLGRVPAYITSKIGLCSPEDIDFSPFEIKKVCVSANLNGFNRELFEENKCHKTVEPSLFLKNSPFIVFNEEGM